MPPTSKRRTATETREWEKILLAWDASRKQANEAQRSAIRGELRSIAQHAGAHDPAEVLKAFYIAVDGDAERAHDPAEFRRFVRDVKATRPDLFHIPEPIPDFRPRAGETPVDAQRARQAAVRRLREMGLTPPLDSSWGDSLVGRVVDPAENYLPGRTPTDEEKALRARQDERLRSLGLAIVGGSVVRVGPERTH